MEKDGLIFAHPFFFAGDGNENIYKN